MNNYFCQQGDVILKPRSALSEAEKRALTPLDHKTLMQGEQTGHHHVALAPDVQLYSGPGGVLFMHAPTGTKIRHEEHKEIEVPPDTYSIGAVLEYDHFLERSRSVID